MENLLTIKRFTIPPLQCSFRLHCHRDHSELKEAGDSWILYRFKPSSDTHKQFLLQSQYPLFVSITYPTGDKARCLSIVKFVAWLFLFDDVVDDLNDVGSSLSGAEELFQCLVSTLEAKEASGGMVPRIVTIALDWWKEISQNMPATQQSRFFQLLEISLTASKSQISFREDKRIPDVQTHIRRRREESLTHLCFLMLEFSLGMELDEEVLNNPLLSELHNAAIDHMLWVNDLLSFKVEYLRGYYDNLPSVVCLNDSIDFQESVWRVCRMIKERDDDVVRLVNEIKSSSLMEKPGLESYVDGIGKWMAGNLHWSYVTARYHGVDEEPKKNVDKALDVVLQAATALPTT